MKKVLISLFTYMLTLIILLQGCGKSTGVILTNNLDNITDIQITSMQPNTIATKTITINDKNLIKKFYDCIMATKTEVHKNPSEKYAITCDPYYTIQVNYNDGKSELIKSGEGEGSTGFYRFLDDKGSWIGGGNSELNELIKQQK
jgi:hypothetical protein